jgi:hypothetical protein
MLLLLQTFAYAVTFVKPVTRSYKSLGDFVDAVINHCWMCCVLLRRDIMNEHGVLAFYAEEVRRLGIETVVRKCIDHVSPE